MSAVCGARAVLGRSSWRSPVRTRPAAQKFFPDDPLRREPAPLPARRSGHAQPQLPPRGGLRHLRPAGRTAPAEGRHRGAGRQYAGRGRSTGRGTSTATGARA